MNEKLSYRKMNVKRGESGQALVLFAVMMMAMMGFLALGIDLALVVGGQRRFDQNGADAAALAAVMLMAGSVGMVHVYDPTTPTNDPH
ncbi:MAG: hypothetical protein HY332_04480, partial [Chloroflexi bacterium]|nr:hypothetical protein [Chloroflexota bacterium]